MIIVLGMHRSGTSMIAQMLHAMGVSMGESFREPDETQPFGYFEDLEFRNLNSAILNRAHGSWYGVPDKRMVSIHAQEFIGNLKYLIAERNEPWGFKDPRTILTIHALHDYLEDPKYIVVRRTPVDDIIFSLERRATARGYWEPTEHWMRLVEIYYERLYQFCIGEGQNAQMFHVKYNDLLNPDTSEDLVRGIAHFCGVGYTKDAFNVIRFNK
jgi:hypothetical protein